tara:strand:- start:2209 stop:4047 length:1839 start_codon:yes stop_codon:yes gene_type:complete
MYILGISAFYHDSAACLVKNGEIVAAAQEERFTRLKHDSSFPRHSINYCLNKENISANELVNVVFYEKPFLKFERLLETYLAFAPSGFANFAESMPVWIKDKLFQKFHLIKELKAILGDNINWQDRLLFTEHHLSHAASAFFPSPFKRAAILTLDGVGEWTTTALSIGNNNKIEIIKEIKFPHSLGLLYSAFTYYLGFKVNSGEYKVMGLAPYGEPRYADLIKDKIINISNDGSFQLDMSYFDFATGLKMTSKKFDDLFGGPPRSPETNLSQREIDIAASIQKVTEDIVLRIAKYISKETGEHNLCLAGGVALNCVVNGIILREGIFENIWIQPAAGDAGGSIGAALAVWHHHYNKDRTISLKRDSMNGSYLGPEFNNSEVERELIACGAVFETCTNEEMIDKTASAIASEKIVGWMQGAMEFGPRALGGRSIIADPRASFMQKQLNLKVKYRESFRPFAPSILAELVDEWFEHETHSPYMLYVANLHKNKRLNLSSEDKSRSGLDKLNIIRSLVPAITHVDYSARIQTVHADTNPLFHSLISKFYEITGCPIIINTSFNVRGEPIVCDATDAYKCFMSTEIDMLVVGNCLLYKNKQKALSKKNHNEEYHLD